MRVLRHSAQLVLLVGLLPSVLWATSLQLGVLANLDRLTVASAVELLGPGEIAMLDSRGEGPTAQKALVTRHVVSLDLHGLRPVDITIEFDPVTHDFEYLMIVPQEELPAAELREALGSPDEEVGCELKLLPGDLEGIYVRKASDEPSDIRRLMYRDGRLIIEVQDEVIQAIRYYPSPPKETPETCP